MNEKQWERFFELLQLIVKQDGTWQEKAEEVKSQAATYDSTGDLEEFTGWFQSEG